MKDLKRFWSWMEKNGYHMFFGETHLILDLSNDGAHPTDQMIIGYMMQYLDNAEWIEELYDFGELNEMTSKERVEWLIRKIEIWEED